MKTYTIKPLKWEKHFCAERQQYRASVPMGTFTVSRTRKEWDATEPWEEWRWEYCFDEYYDESYSKCKDAADGKQKCWEEWLKRITPALQETPNPLT